MLQICVVSLCEEPGIESRERKKGIASKGTGPTDKKTDEKTEGGGAGIKYTCGRSTSSDRTLERRGGKSHDGRHAPDVVP